LAFLDRTDICFLTTNNCVSTVSWQTFAYHGSNWASVQDFAHGVNTARLDLRAWIDAMSIEARRLRRTFVVCFAFFFNFGTSGSSVTNVAGRTHAFNNMIVNVALHITGTRVHSTRILAAVIDARLVRRTVRVAFASQQDARDSWIATKARRTLANCLVIYTMAN
jgi:hypothetical protein